MIPLSVIDRGLSALKEYDWHRDAVVRTALVSSGTTAPDIVVSGESVVNGVFNEIADFKVYAILEAEVRVSVERYLVHVLEKLTSELQHVGIDAKA